MFTDAARPRVPSCLLGWGWRHKFWKRQATELYEVLIEAQRPARSSQTMRQRLIFSVLAGSFCGLLFGYDIGAMAGAAPNIRTAFALAPASLGMAVSAALFGTIPGSIAAGFLADALGRRATLSVATFLYAFALIGAAAAQGLSLFVASRFCCGLAIGLISVTAPMYLAEVAPSRLRGRIVGLFQLSVSVGVVAAFLLGYLFSLHGNPERSWRLMLSCAVLPALMGELSLLRASVSPRWLASRARLDETRFVMKDLGFAQQEIDALANPLERAGAAAQSASLFSRQYLRPILLGISIAAFNQLTGVNALLYYILDVFHDLGSGRLNGRADALALAVLGLVVTMLAVMVMDSVGRRPLLLSGAAGMGLCLLLLPLIRHYNWPATTVVVVIAAYDACFGFSQGSVIWVYLSEIFPLPVRARGQSLGSTVHWITNAFVVGIFPAMTSRWGQRVFVGLALVMVAQFLVILLFYPETRGRTLESLASQVSG